MRRLISIVSLTYLLYSPKFTRAIAAGPPGAYPTDEMEQLGLLRPDRRRSRVSGQYEMDGRAPQEAGLGIRRHHGRWYLQNPQISGKPGLLFTLSGDGHYLPALNRFPSAAHDLGKNSGQSASLQVTLQAHASVLYRLAE